jgi:4'-phosphopantetheinyl transferase EntD
MRDLLARLLPEGASCAVVAIDEHDRGDNDDDERRLHPDEAAVVAGAVEKRRREFAAGRRAARTALDALGVVVEQPLLPDADRVPRWPRGFSGSITHSDRLAAAAAVPSTVARGVGVDLEDDDVLVDELWPLVLTAAERAALDAAAATTGLSTGACARLHFCAKESLYKCVFPLVRVPFDFTDVDVEFDAHEAAFVARVHKPGAGPGRVLRGRWGRAAQHFAAATWWP